MKLEAFPAGITDWSQVPATAHTGESGTATMRVIELGGVRVRIVECSAGFTADHWCHKGHIIFGVSGEATLERRDGSAHTLSAGATYHVPDDDSVEHRLVSAHGAKMFVVD
jgi:hypothetical protein